MPPLRAHFLAPPPRGLSSSLTLSPAPDGQGVSPPSSQMTPLPSGSLCGAAAGRLYSSPHALSSLLLCSSGLLTMPNHQDLALALPPHHHSGHPFGTLNIPGRGLAGILLSWPFDLSPLTVNLSTYSYHHIWRHVTTRTQPLWSISSSGGMSLPGPSPSGASAQAPRTLTTLIPASHTVMTRCSTSHRHLQDPSAPLPISTLHHPPPSFTSLL